MNSEKSYARILNASFIMGGAAGITLLLGMLRVKTAAVLLGAVGVGLNASFASVQAVISMLVGLGIQTSAVRDIAAASGKGDPLAIGRAAFLLRRFCWISGAVGMGLTIGFSSYISRLTFGHEDYAWDISGLGIVVWIASLSGGQMAILQGTGRIYDLARANILGAVVGTIGACCLYMLLGLRGVVPALAATAAAQFFASWYYARRERIPSGQLTLAESFHAFKGMMRLGMAMMSSGLMISGAAYITITLIAQQEGLGAVGLYSAAIALSGVFVNFVLNAIGTDHYPRLTAIAPDSKAMGRLLNEQIEISLLLSLPGLLVTLIFAPWLVYLFYSDEFKGAAFLLQWFILGCAARIAAWPFRYVSLALGRARWFMFTEGSFHLIYLILLIVGLKFDGLRGVALAYCGSSVAYMTIVYGVARNLIDFRWSLNCLRTVVFAGLTLLSVFIALHYRVAIPEYMVNLISIVVVAMVSLRCLYVLIGRVGEGHRITRIAMRVPGVRRLLQ